MKEINKKILKEASILLIITSMILSTVVVTADLRQDTKSIEKATERYLDFDQNSDTAPTSGVRNLNAGDFPILFEFDLFNAYSVGVGFDGTNFWVSAGHGLTGFCEFYLYDQDGTLIETVHQGGGATGWGHNDMAWDGDYMFGSYDILIDGFSDLSTYEGNFQGAISPNRALAYDGTYFYTCGFGQMLYQLEWDGNWGSIATSTTLSGPFYGAYGLAYDEIYDCLWMTNADYTGDIYKLDMDGNILETYTCLPEYNIQGGCTMANTTTYGYVLVVLQQSIPDKLTFYQVHAAEPDLDCEGDILWEDVVPGDTVTDTFTVSNVGEPYSFLNWEIESYPDWGTWTFDPDSGIGLSEGDSITVDVEVIAPDNESTEFTGEIVLVNSDDPNDICTIPVKLVTPCNLDIGRVWLRGLLFRCNHVGNVNTGMALRLHYIEFTPTERGTGTVMMNRVTFKDPARTGRMYEFGAGLLTYVIGFFEGGLEIL